MEVTPAGLHIVKPKDKMNVVVVGEEYLVPYSNITWIRLAACCWEWNGVEWIQIEERKTVAGNQLGKTTNAEKAKAMANNL